MSFLPLHLKPIRFGQLDLAYSRDLSSLSASTPTSPSRAAMSLTLKHLHLDPTPVSSISSPESEEFRQSLLEEALKLLDSDLWTDRKEHHGGLVETFGFPVQ
jgi:hypothetical protein